MSPWRLTLPSMGRRADAAAGFRRRARALGIFVRQAADGQAIDPVSRTTAHQIGRDVQLEIGRRRWLRRGRGGDGRRHRHDWGRRSLALRAGRAHRQDTSATSVSLYVSPHRFSRSLIHIKAASCRIVEAFIDGAGVTSIPLETLASVVGRAPAFDGPVALLDLDDAPKPADHGERAVLEDCADDAADFPVTARAEINADRMEEAPAADGADRDDCAKYARSEALAMTRRPRDRRAAADRAGIPGWWTTSTNGLTPSAVRSRNLRTGACDIALGRIRGGTDADNLARAGGGYT